ncbi:uncharacterized protein N7446_007870 [Penicillium canescens]|uniref:Uncharacterized protein n=1 Tax=Penicillium canescens TaxID=5083 RepID=A0AAD6IM97_PENCN|nr:uncharacterized protein N7446_007870 [Penicillium canescens]KAJ6033839.1 hypothetical protein N7444_011610 [Penicillium canescens]KAJ6056971.1 hypothetical protein N7460_000245 [Penicillium canescens]KAJ6058287.1 hypothetical protein N7446_007870 [Penicillium canescens]
MRYWVNHTEPVALPDGHRPESEPPTYPVSEAGAQAQREDSPSVCDAAWKLLILAYESLERTDDTSKQAAAVFCFVGWLFADAILEQRNQGNLDPVFSNDIMALLSQVRRIAKQRLRRQVSAASKEFRTYLDEIGFSVGDSEDAWIGLKALDAWFEKRGESGPMGIERVMLDASERSTIVHTIMNFDREWQTNGTTLGMSFDSVGGTRKTTTFDGNGRQINYVCTGSGQQYIVEN